MALQRLQKILAQAGVASRRSAERLILDGRVRVNGRIVSELGARANPLRDRVEVDGKRLVAERPVYFLMHKPRGVVTTLDDPEGRKSIKDLLRSVTERVFPVGRLDFQTSGALLLTNDGAMAQALLHPTRRVPKVYHAKIQGSLDEQRLELLRSGVTLDDGERTGPAEVDIVRKDDKHTFIEVTISEGKNRQIHRMLDAVGRVVLRLTRLAFADLPLEGLRPGEMRPLTQPELSDLKQKYLNPSKKVRRGASGAPASAEAEADEFEDAPEPSSEAPVRESSRGPSAGGRGRVVRGADPRGPYSRPPRPQRDDTRGAGPSRSNPRRPSPRGPDPRGQDPRGRDAGTSDPRGPYSRPPRPDPRGPNPNPRRPSPRDQDPREADRRDTSSRRPSPRGRDPRDVDPRGADPRHENPRRPSPRREDARGADPRDADPRGFNSRRSNARGRDPRGTDPRDADPRALNPRRPSPRGPDPRGEDPRRADPRGLNPRRPSPRGPDPRGEDARRADPRGKSPRRPSPRGPDPRGQDPRGQDPRGRRDAKSFDDRARRTRRDSPTSDPRTERKRAFDPKSKTGQRGRKRR